MTTTNRFRGYQSARDAETRRERERSLTNYLPRCKTPAFITLLDATAARLGSFHAVERRFGFDTRHIDDWRAGRRPMREDIARKILAAHKTVKAEHARA